MVKFYWKLCLKDNTKKKEREILLEKMSFNQPGAQIDRPTTDFKDQIFLTCEVKDRVLRKYTKQQTQNESLQFLPGGS